MAVDILGLGYKVDTGDIKRAERDLDKFASANKKAAGNVDDLSTQSDKAARTTSSLARSLGTLAGAFLTLQAASSLVRIADEYTKFTAQLKLATDSVEQFQSAYGELVAIARSSQSDIAGLGTLYARITNATREMGLAQGDVAKISETVALSLRVSGASASESASAMLQLSQAFGSGVLRGEEFNAVNEAAPGLLRALAESIGVPVGALREMASNGELTADVLARAFKDDELLAKLREQAKEVQTVGSAITGLKTELTLAIGELDKATGASKGLAGAITGIAAAIAGFDQVYPSIEPYLEGGIVVGGFLALNAVLNTLLLTTIPGLLAALPAIKAAMLPIIVTLGPLVAGFAAFAAAVGYSTKLAKEAGQPQIKLNKLYEEQARLQAEIAERGKDATNTFLGMSTGGKTLEQQLADVQANIVNVSDELYNALKVGVDFEKVQGDIANATKPVITVIKEQTKQTKSVTDATKEFNRIQDEGRRVFEQTRTPIENANIELARLQSLLDQGAISWDTYGRAVFAVEDALEKVATAIPEDEKFRQAAEALMAANKDIADTFKDDLLDSIKTAFLQSGKFGEAFARGLKAELIEAFLDPALGAAINQAKSGNFSSIAGIASAGFTAGSSGAALGALLSNANGIASKLVSITGATGQTSAAMLQLGNNLSKIAPYAGSIAALIQGDVKGAAGAALGTYIGNILLPGIGGAIGGTLGSLLGGSGKISATALGPEFGQNVTKALADQYAATAAALGGTAAGVVFGAGGNTGRQGQNPNFTLGASFGGRSIFGSAQTREGQQDGLFLSGEIALNQANLADQSLRALVAALQQTDFADNIDAVVDSVNAATGSFAELEGAIAAAQLLNAVNGFKDMEGAIASLSGASAEVVGEFFELVGGLDGLNQGMAAFYDAFYTEQEKTERLTKQVTNAFAAFGQVVPTTREGLRELVDGLDLQDDKQQKLFATILQLTPALDQLIPAFEQVEDAARSLFGDIPGMLDDALGKQISLSREAADQARDAASAYRSLNKSLADSARGVLGLTRQDQTGSLRQQFEASFAVAATGDKDALRRLGGEASEYLESFKNSATTGLQFTLEAVRVSNKLNQAASVADVLATGSDFQAQLFDVQTAALEVVKEQLEAGNLTLETLQSHTALLENIAQQIVASGQLTVGATTNAAGETIGALFNANGLIVGQLANDSVLNVQALANQSGFLSGSFNNSITGQTASLGGLTQEQISKLQALNSVQSQALDLTDIVAQATDGSETLLQAVLNKLGQQDTGSANIVASLKAGNIEITNYLAQIAAAVKQQSEAAAAEVKRVQDLAKAQADLAVINDQRNTAIAGVQQGIQNIRTLEAQVGASTSKNLFNEAFEAAIFRVNSEGLFEADFDSIFGNFTAFKNAFYSAGGAYDQTYGQAGALQSLKDQIEAQRKLVISLGGIPQFAQGGMYQGGLALVGEQGPELINFNRGGMVYTAEQTERMMRPMNGNSDAMATEIRALREEVKMLRSENRIGMATIAQGTTKTANLLDDVTQGAERLVTVVEPM